MEAPRPSTTSAAFRTRYLRFSIPRLDLYATPGIAATVKPRIHVQNYYSIRRVNPTGIIPKGTPIDLSEPPTRARIFDKNCVVRALWLRVRLKSPFHALALAVWLEPA